jgi:hypothetical protein
MILPEGGSVMYLIKSYISTSFAVSQSDSQSKNVYLCGPVMTGLKRSNNLPALTLFYLIVSILFLQTSFHWSGLFM